MFQFPGFPSLARFPLLGVFPHSDICGSRLICSSPQLFAACHVLLRRLMPRHPPYALLCFVSVILLYLRSLALMFLLTRLLLSFLFSIYVSILTFYFALLVFNFCLCYAVVNVPFRIKKHNDLFLSLCLNQRYFYTWSAYTVCLICGTACTLSIRAALQRDSLLILPHYFLCVNCF